jgi:hypothetical protein
VVVVVNPDDAEDGVNDEGVWPLDGKLEPDCVGKLLAPVPGGTDLKPVPGHCGWLVVAGAPGWLVEDVAGVVGRLRGSVEPLAGPVVVAFGTLLHPCAEAVEAVEEAAVPEPPRLPQLSQ